MEPDNSQACSEQEIGEQVIFIRSNSFPGLRSKGQACIRWHNKVQFSASTNSGIYVWLCFIRILEYNYYKSICKHTKCTPVC